MCLSTPPAAVQALPLAAAALAAIGAGMVLLWLWQRRTRNAAIVDVGWTVGLGLLGIAYALLLEGSAMRRALLGIMVGLWSLRLAVHLVRDRVAGRPEEGRYERLRAHWGDRAQPYLLLFFGAILLMGLPMFRMDRRLWLVTDGGGWLREYALSP